MKILIKKIHIILFLLILLSVDSKVFGKSDKTQYTRENISNYFLGIISANLDHNQKAFNYLKKVKSLKDEHSRFNVEYIRTLILLEKFEQAISFSKNVWKENDSLFEADLLLGLNYFVKEDYINAEKYFERLIDYEYHFLVGNFISKVLLSWSKASQGNKEASLKFIQEIPTPYSHLTKTQNSFLQCFFNSKKTEESLKELIQDKNYNFSRYNFFLINYLLLNNKNDEAKKIIKISREKYNSNLLIKQTEKFFLNEEYKKIKNFFNCKNPNDSIAELFYVIANLYSSEKDYQMSNFYLKLSLFLNKKFLPNKALLAENYFYQRKNKLSKNVYYSLKSIGSEYSWHASKSIATILLQEKGKKYSIKSLEDEFNSLRKPTFEHYYELANFYKDNEYYNKSVEYYSLALKKINENHFLVPKILDRRGSSFERLGDWESAEKDLMQSLEILPDQPHVLNYLAYTWVDKGINLDKGLKMLKKASELRKNDGYIIDSLGWAYYAKKNYSEAERFLQRAVELMPTDPIINDHYADTLWMLNKNIQARYVWKYVLKLEDTEEELKDIINKKLIFGITKKL